MKKATLTLHVKTDKGTGEGISAGTTDVKTPQAIAHAWVLDGKYTSFAAKSQLPVIASYPILTTPGSTGDVVYDAAEGTPYHRSHQCCQPVADQGVGQIDRCLLARMRMI